MDTANNSYQSVKEPLDSNAVEFMRALQTRQQNGGTEPGYEERTFKEVPAVEMRWRAVRYMVRKGRGKAATERAVLCDIDGAAPSGRVLAVMGPTGSGKTSLINALAGRLPSGSRASGQVFVNGKPQTKQFWSLSAYVTQDDVMFSMLTVRETFSVAAALRLPRHMSRDEKRGVVDRIIADLGLAKAADTVVGDVMTRGVSGGERKRTSIGIEMISNPSVLFLDEPTSGLDSFQAQSVVQSLAHLAQHGRTIICTIHQPRSSIYNMFDLLMLLSEGKVMYYGAAHAAIDYFSGFGFVCPSTYNPADFFMDVVSLDYRTAAAEESSRSRVALLADAYNTRHAKDAGALVVDDGGTDVRGRGVRTFATNWFVQFGVLYRRSFLQAMRFKFPVIVGCVQAVVMSLLLGAIYSNIQKDQKGIQDLTGVLFFICIFSVFGQLFSVLNTFPKEKLILNKERAAKAYRVSAYYIAKVTAEFPFKFSQVVLFAVIMYWIVGLNPAADRFVIFIVVLVALAMASQGLGSAISAAAPSADVAFAIAPLITVLMILFGGFYINADSLPKGARWVKYVSHVYWGYLALATNDLRGATGWTCDTVQHCDPNTGECTTETQSAQASGCLTTGDEILERLSFADAHVWQGILGLLALWFGLNALAYVLLRINKPRVKLLVQGSNAAVETKPQNGLPSSNTVVPDNKSVMPENNSVVPGNHIVAPDGSVVEPNISTAAPGNDTVVPDSDTVVPFNSIVVATDNDVATDNKNV